jgi:hypothetical protein
MYTAPTDPFNFDSSVASTVPSTVPWETNGFGRLFCKRGLPSTAACSTLIPNHRDVLRMGVNVKVEVRTAGIYTANRLLTSEIVRDG